MESGEPKIQCPRSVCGSFETKKNRIRSKKILIEENGHYLRQKLPRQRYLCNKCGHPFFIESELEKETLRRARKYLCKYYITNGMKMLVENCDKIIFDWPFLENHFSYKKRSLQVWIKELKQSAEYAAIFEEIKSELIKENDQYKYCQISKADRNGCYRIEFTYGKNHHGPSF